MPEETVLASQETQSRAGKYLTFALADEEYGLEILKVREIIGMMEITAVPRTPKYVKGVINLRGKVIPVVDLRMKVGMAEAERTDETCVIVVDIGDVEMGIVVDHVSEVLDIAEEDIEDAPSFGAQVNTDYILGMGKLNDKVTILLDISKLLSSSDMTVMDMAVDSATQNAPETHEDSEAQASDEQASDEEVSRESQEPQNE
ncbi:MAG: chemotaxis protein CheW [Planctomycetes bacterium]|nr:chemotaxis protein CheW [Planctomycetota bacterium]